MDASEQKVLIRNARYVAHMRAEKDDRRFGLVLGAGVSLPLGFPLWSELVRRVADHPDVNGKHVIQNVGGSLPDTSKTQMLFQHYRSKIMDVTGGSWSAKAERKIQGQWRRIIQECLYRDVKDTGKELQTTHPYLTYFIKVIEKSAMTVNYNFDDTIQQMILSERHSPNANSMRNFETIWSAYLPTRPDVAILYHPNGFLPRNLLEYPSDNLVFSDDSFADQLIESMAGYHASLLHHFSKNTCLFLGLSL
jgi:hypothetical protein